MLSLPTTTDTPSTSANANATATTASNAAGAIMTEASLLRLIASFQSDLPIAFKPLMATYAALGRGRHAEWRRTAYADTERDRCIRVAHAVGFSGDTRAADLLLRTWRDTENLNLLHEIAYPAMRCGKTPMVKWVLERCADTRGVKARVDRLVRFAATGQENMLRWLEKQLGRDRIAQAFDDAAFRDVAIHDSCVVLRWLSKRGVLASVADYLLHFAVAAGRRGVVEFLHESMRDGAPQMDPVMLMGAIGYVHSEGYPVCDDSVAEVLELVIESQPSLLHNLVVTALVQGGCMVSARVIMARTTQAGITFTWPILEFSSVVASSLLESDDILTVRLILNSANPHDIISLANAIRPHHSRAVVIAIREACEAHALMEGYLISTSARELMAQVATP